MDYFVPNFGRDKREVLDTWGSLDWAQKHLNHVWIPAEKPKPGPDFEDFRVPDFGLDSDVIDSLSHAAEQEKVLNHKWTPKQDENGVWIVPKPIDNASY